MAANLYMAVRLPGLLILNTGRDENNFLLCEEPLFEERVRAAARIFAGLPRPIFPDIAPDEQLKEAFRSPVW